MSYIARVQSHEYKYPKGVTTEARTWFWVTWSETDHWISSREVNHPLGMVDDPMVWETRDEAEKLLKQWKGHPYWCVPNGIYEILEVRPHMKEVQDGWEIVE